MNPLKFCLIILYFIIIRLCVSFFMVLILNYDFILEETIVYLLFTPFAISFLLYVFPVKLFYSRKEKFITGCALAIVHFVSVTCVTGLTFNLNMMLVCLGSIIYIVVLSLDEICKIGCFELFKNTKC